MCCFRIVTSWGVTKFSNHAHKTGAWFLLGFFFFKFLTSTPILIIWETTRFFSIPVCKHLPYDMYSKVLIKVPTGFSGIPIHVRKQKNKPITMFDSGACDWFVLPLLLSTSPCDWLVLPLPTLTI